MLHVDDEICTLRPRLAELPTTTSVGMNMLSPLPQPDMIHFVWDNQEIAGIQGVGGFKLVTDQDRKTAIKNRVDSHSKLSKVVLTKTNSKEISLLHGPEDSVKSSVGMAKILILHFRGIRKVAEKGDAQTFEDALKTLRLAWLRLRELNYYNFVFASTHGFLHLDKRAKDTLSSEQSHTRARCLVTPTLKGIAEGVHISSKELGYGDEFFITTPKNTSVFEGSSFSHRFVCGGNSLQERVIPLLTLQHPTPKAEKSESFVLSAHLEPSQSKYKVLRVIARHLTDKQLSLTATEVTHVELEILPNDLSVGVGDFAGVTVDIPESLPDPDILRHRGLLKIPVNKECIVLFRLIGAKEATTRIKLKVPNTNTEAYLLPQWLDVEGNTTAIQAVPVEEETVFVTEVPVKGDWIDAIPEAYRTFFAYLSEHQTLSEQDAAELLGGPRKLRRLRLKLDALTALAPFSIRVEHVDGRKNFVREGETS